MSKPYRLDEIYHSLKKQEALEWAMSRFALEFDDEVILAALEQAKQCS